MAALHTCRKEIDPGGRDPSSGGSSTQTWSVNNYGKGLTRPCVIYTDEHQVERA